MDLLQPPFVWVLVFFLVGSIMASFTRTPYQFLAIIFIGASHATSHDNVLALIVVYLMAIAVHALKQSSGI